MWKKIKDVMTVLYHALWVEPNWKQKVSVSVATIIGLILGTTCVHVHLAKKGCAVSRDFGNLLFGGFMGLGVLIVSMFMLGYFVHWVLNVPQHLEELKKEPKRSGKEFLLNVFSVDNIKVLLFVVSLLVGSILICTFAGYIWWFFLC